VRVPALVMPERCAAWCAALDAAISVGGVTRKVYETPADPTILNDGGLFDHYIVDGYVCRAIFPHMHHVYAEVAALVACLTGLDVIASPYERSAVNVNRYDPPTGQMSAHFDSNPISGILYMTTLLDGGTSFLRSTGEVFHAELPVAGDLLIFKGREIKHRADLVRTGIKVVGVWNYYTREDTWRPTGMDDFMYGKPRRS
jgi:hypothetical protein